MHGLWCPSPHTQLAACGYIRARQSHLQTTSTQSLPDHMRRGLALGRGGGQDHSPHCHRWRVKQFCSPMSLGPMPSERTELAHQPKVQTLVGAGALQCRLVCGRFHHTHSLVRRAGCWRTCCTTATRRRCGTTRNARCAGLYRSKPGPAIGHLAVVLQKVKRHALRRLGPPPQVNDAGPAPKPAKHRLASSKSVVRGRAVVVKTAASCLGAVQR